MTQLGRPDPGQGAIPFVEATGPTLAATIARIRTVVSEAAGHHEHHADEATHHLRAYAGPACSDTTFRTEGITSHDERPVLLRSDRRLRRQVQSRGGATMRLARGPLSV